MDGKSLPHLAPARQNPKSDPIGIYKERETASAVTETVSTSKPRSQKTKEQTSNEYS